MQPACDHSPYTYPRNAQAIRLIGCPATNRWNFSCGRLHVAARRHSQSSSQPSMSPAQVKHNIIHQYCLASGFRGDMNTKWDEL